MNLFKLLRLRVIASRIRKPGFYWVKLNSDVDPREEGEWTIARFTSDYGEREWWTTGWDGMVKESDLYEVNENRIKTPEEL